MKKVNVTPTVPRELLEKAYREIQANKEKANKSA